MHEPMAMYGWECYNIIIRPLKFNSISYVKVRSLGRVRFLDRDNDGITVYMSSRTTVSNIMA